jgi:serine/threonine protein kinase
MRILSQDSSKNSSATSGFSDFKQPLLGRSNESSSSASAYTSNANPRHTGGLGTVGWQAPELLTGKLAVYNEKVDIYAFGILLYCLLTGKQPFHDKNSAWEIAELVRAGKRPYLPESKEEVPDEWRMLINDCWAQDQRARPQAAEIERRLSMFPMEYLPGLLNNNNSNSNSNSNSPSVDSRSNQSFRGSIQSFRGSMQSSRSSQGQLSRTSTNGISFHSQKDSHQEQRESV